MSLVRGVLGLVWLLSGILWPLVVQSQSLDTRHASILDPLLYGSTCTSATLNAALSAAAAATTASRVLMLTPVDRNRAPCLWAITSDVVVPRTMTLWVPQGAMAAISGAITLTVKGALIAEDPLWWRGPGTLLAPLPTAPRTASSIEAGCTPTLPSASLTLAPFACQALIAQSDHVWGVAQEPAAVTVAATPAVQWLAVCRDVETVYPGWSRVPETHYLHCASTGQPPAPPGCLLLTRVGVSGGVITNLTPVAASQKTRADTDIVYAEDFGAVFTQGVGPLAVTADDCGAALNAAIAVLPLQGGTIQLGRGACQVHTTIAVSKPVRLLGHGAQSPVGPQSAATSLVKGPDLNGPVLRITANAVHLADFDIQTLPGTPGAGNGIDILASYGSLTRVGVYSQQGSGIQVCHPTTVANCIDWLFTGVLASYNQGSGLFVTGYQGSPTLPDSTSGVVVHGGAFTSNQGDGITLLNTRHNTIVGPDIGANGDFGIHLVSWTFENTISVGRVVNPNLGPYDVVIGASAAPSYGNYVLSMPSTHTRLHDQTPLFNGGNMFVYHLAGGASTVQTGLGGLFFNGIPHNVPIGYLRTHATVGSGLAVVTEGEALTEANAKLLVKKAGVRLGGPGSQTIKANASAVNIVNFGLSIPAHTTLHAQVAIAAVVGDACYASMTTSVGANIGQCGCRILTTNLAELCIINPTASAVPLATVTWRTVVFNY